MFIPRPKEQNYAFVPDAAHPPANRYGKPIETVPEENALRGASLNINGNTDVSTNPKRYKQHGFYFTADNCISCHACEAACSEKNDLPAHIAFRSVGYLEGGSWPSSTRLNISMACNHCDNPVCLKGCPTRAYTKFAEYGAVLQDPDICFGCGYCTWVCPYNAPQLDPVAGHVSKCNMCVDRLEAGLKPACAAACLAGALDFGIIETTPENRVQTETRIPGFPTPEITHPNIRFQQVKTLPRELTRADSMPLRYVRDGLGDQQDAVYRPQVREDGRGRSWGLRKLSTRENPLVVFTLITQAVIGAFALQFLAPLFGKSLFASDGIRSLLLVGMIIAEVFALVLSTMHLGRPHRFYRAFNNLRYSPVSREVAGVAVFFNLLIAYTLVTAFPVLTSWLPAGLAQPLPSLLGGLGVVAGLAALYFMHRIYRIPARPFWNHWQVLTSFYGSMLALGSLLLVAVVAAQSVAADTVAGVPLYLTLPLLAGLALEAAGLYAHRRHLHKIGGEGAASHYLQTTTFGYTYLTRNALLGFTLALLTALAVTQPGGWLALAAWTLAGAGTLLTGIIGRMLFYALVIPTTMPGAFFWRNRGFEEHARATGLARMPQVGVVPETH